jgi:hypothetical protein
VTRNERNARFVLDVFAAMDQYAANPKRRDRGAQLTELLHALQGLRADYTAAAVAEAATPEPEPETDGKVDCPVCGRRVALRAGRINRHFNYDNEFDPTCPGSGRKL